MSEAPIFPSVLAEVAEVIGPDATLRLWAACRGCTIHVPKRLAGRSPLVGVLNTDDLSRLQVRFPPGDRFVVPGVSRVLQQFRDRRLLRLRAQRRTVAEVAVTLGMTERGVYKALERLRTRRSDTRQLDLFFAAVPEPVQV